MFFLRTRILAVLCVLSALPASAQSCADTIMDKVKPDQNAQAAFEALAGCIAQQAATIKTLRTDNAGSPALPSGIVVASTVACSDLTNGPWSAFTDGAGRFIIGAGAHSNHDLSSYAVFGDKVSGWQEAIGGEEMVTLTMDEMPRHTHRIDMFYGREFDGTGGATPRRAPETRSTAAARAAQRSGTPPFYAVITML